MPGLWQRQTFRRCLKYNLCSLELKCASWDSLIIIMIKLFLGCLSLKILPACETGRSTWGTPRTHWRRDYASHLPGNVLEYRRRSWEKVVYLVLGTNIQKKIDSKVKISACFHIHRNGLKSCVLQYFIHVTAVPLQIWCDDTLDAPM